MNISDFKNKMNLLAEEVGIHIGDGSMNFYLNDGKRKGLYQLRGHIVDDRDYYLQHLQKLYQKTFGLNISVRDMKSTGVLGFQIWNDELVNFKKHLGLPLGWKIDLVIPKLFLQNDEVKANVLKGIFDTDGCIYLEKRKWGLYPRVEIRTNSTFLAKQIVGILKDFNIRATSYLIKRENKNWRDLTCISVRGIYYTTKFFKKVKPNNPKHLNKFKKLLNSN